MKVVKSDEEIAECEHTAGIPCIRETRYRKVLASVMDGFWLVDMEGRIVDANEAYSRMSGYTRQELIGMTIGSFEAIESSLEIVERTWQIKERGAARFETKHRGKDGSIFDIESSIQYADIEGGRMVVFIRDITERVQTKRESVRLHAELAHSQKLELLGKLAGSVAHDFNNMLAVILGHTELALEDPDKSMLQEDLNQIRTAASRAADISRQLLVFTRKQQLVPKVMDLNESITSTLKMLQKLLGESIHLNWKPIPSQLLVSIDPIQIDQTIINLCINARDAISQSGHVVIATGVRVMSAPVAPMHTNITPGGYVWLSVSDDGCGMDVETLQHIFEPFYTTKNVDKGTGLGLAIVHDIVYRNNGFIEVTSIKGQGTTFKVYLPRHEHMSKDGEDFQIPSYPGGTETILVVEDTQSIQILVRRMLVRLGYTPHVVSSAQEGIQFFESHSNIDLLMTDVVMPGMNGFELSAHLKIPTVYMSGYSQESFTEKEKQSRRDARFLQKPFTIQDIAVAIRETLDRRK
ncbi:MAG: ATP-binding protein [Candidatus Uhrbacteria bacterium]